MEHIIVAMAAIMVAACRAREDVGALVATALRTAAECLAGGAECLVVGRPGSWEAQIICRMALAGGGVVKPERVRALAELCISMAEARADGGDVLSRAMGRAVDGLGGFVPFLGTSGWYWDLANLACQYTREWSDNPYKEASTR